MVAARLSKPAVSMPLPLWRGSRSLPCTDRLGTAGILHDPRGCSLGTSGHLHVLAMSLLPRHPLTSVAKAQGTLPLRIVESSVLHVVVGTRTLVGKTWPCPTGFLALLLRVGVAVIVSLACLGLCPISLFVLLVYTYPLSLGRPKSHCVCK